MTLANTAYADFTLCCVLTVICRKTLNMAMLRSVFFIALLLLSIVARSQSREALEERRKSVLQKIETTNQVLEKTLQNRVSELGQLRSLLKQIEQRNELIQNLSKDIELLETDIYQTADIVKALNRDLEDLKEEYASMIYMASKTRSGSSYQQLSYLFASESVNQLLNRLNYLKQYKETRHYQIEQIEQVASMLQGKQQVLQQQKADRQQLLAQEQAQQFAMEKMRQKQASLVKTLSTQEKSLKADLSLEQTALNNIERTLNPVVAQNEENQPLLAAVEEAPVTPVNTVADAKAPGVNVGLFVNNQAKLKWPVEEGFVSGKFGKQKHPVFEDVWVDNNGIDITTSANAPVKAVFDGQVSAVSQIPGMQNVIMVQHGNFYTVYARLKTSSVKPGQQVKAGEILGLVGQNKDGVPALQFQVWKRQQKLDPEQWLSQ